MTFTTPCSGFLPFARKVSTKNSKWFAHESPEVLSPYIFSAAVGMVSSVCVSFVPTVC